MSIISWELWEYLGGTYNWAQQTLTYHDYWPCCPTSLCPGQASSQDEFISRSKDKWGKSGQCILYNKVLFTFPWPPPPTIKLFIFLLFLMVFPWIQTSVYITGCPPDQHALLSSGVRGVAPLLWVGQLCLLFHPHCCMNVRLIHPRECCPLTGHRMGVAHRCLKMWVAAFFTTWGRVPVFPLAPTLRAPHLRSNQGLSSCPEEQRGWPRHCIIPFSQC